MQRASQQRYLLSQFSQFGSSAARNVDAGRTPMSEQPAVDAAAVFAIVNDPQYNALRLRLKIDGVEQIRGDVNAGTEKRTSGAKEHADVVRGPERG